MARLVPKLEPGGSIPNDEDVYEALSDEASSWAGFWCPFCQAHGNDVSIAPPEFHDDNSNVICADAHCNKCKSDWQVTYFFGIILPSGN